MTTFAKFSAELTDAYIAFIKEAFSNKIYVSKAINILPQISRNFNIFYYLLNINSQCTAKKFYELAKIYNLVNLTFESQRAKNLFRLGFDIFSTNWDEISDVEMLQLTTISKAKAFQELNKIEATSHTQAQNIFASLNTATDLNNRLKAEALELDQIKNKQHFENWSEIGELLYNSSFKSFIESLIIIGAKLVATKPEILKISENYAKRCYALFLIHELNIERDQTDLKKFIAETESQISRFAPEIKDWL